MPEPVLTWLRARGRAAAAGREPRTLPVERTIDGETRQLVFALQQRTGDDDLLIVMREVSDAAVVEAMVQAFKLTLREAEVLYWVAKGKTNRDIGDILGSQPGDGEEAPRARLREARRRDAHRRGRGVASARLRQLDMAVRVSTPRRHTPSGVFRALSRHVS